MLSLPAVILFVLILWVVGRYSFFLLPGFHRGVTFLAFCVKLAGTALLFYIYTFYYPDIQEADVYKFILDGRILADFFHHDKPGFFKILLGLNQPDEYNFLFSRMISWKGEFSQVTGNDNHFMIRLNAIVAMLSGGSSLFHFIFFSFLSFTGLVGFYKVFFKEHLNKYLLFAVVFLLPSVVFFTGGPLKESMIVFAVGVGLYCFVKLKTFFSVSRFALIFICLLILLLLKFYILICVVIALPFMMPGERFYFKVLISYLLLAALALASTFTRYDVFEILAKKQAHAISFSQGGVVLTRGEVCALIKDENRSDIMKVGSNNYKIKRGASYLKWEVVMADTIFVTNNSDTASWKLFSDRKRAGSYFDLQRLSSEPWSFLHTIPHAIANCFRPYLNQIKTVFDIFPWIENMMLFIIAFFGFRTRKEWKKVAALLVFAFSIMILVGLTTPVAGNVVRYRMPAMLAIGIALALTSAKHYSFFRKDKI